MTCSVGMNSPSSFTLACFQTKRTSTSCFNHECAQHLNLLLTLWGAREVNSIFERRLASLPQFCLQLHQGIVLVVFNATSQKINVGVEPSMIEQKLKIVGHGSTLSSW